MLVLTRKEGEAIVIDGAVRVTVVGVKGGRVRLGVRAPADVPVLRAELCDRYGSAGPTMPAYSALGAAVDPSEFLTEADLAP